MTSSAANKGKTLDKDKIYRINELIHQNKVTTSIVAQLLCLAKRTVYKYTVKPEEWVKMKAEKEAERKAKIEK
jgi:predicted transcriptional regulator YheO